MAKSRNRPQYKVKKKLANIKKQKQREMQNAKQEQPVTFVYNKNKQTVEVPIQAWQTLNQAAQQLQSIALFVSTMELVGQNHMTDGTLLPVFNKDLEDVPGTLGPNGKPQQKIKDSFWESTPVVYSESPQPEMEKPLIVEADGKTIYNSANTESKVAI
jgi:hypothetical protein